MSLFCGNISHNASPRDVESLFMKFGQCRVDVKRGFAFVDFEDDRDAEDAMKELQGQDVHGMRINVEWSKRHLARRGMYAGRRHDHGRERHERERGYGGAYSDRGHDRDRGRHERERRDYDERGRDRYDRRDERYERDREDRYRDRERDRDGGDRYRERSRERGGERESERGAVEKHRDSSPRGAGWKRSLDDGQVEQGDQSRRRTEDGYSREKEAANGNGSAADSRDYQHEDKDDERKEDKKKDRKESPFDDRRDEPYVDQPRDEPYAEDRRSRDDAHDEPQGQLSPLPSPKANGDAANGDVNS